MYFDVKGPGIKSTRDRTLIRLLKSPSIMVSPSGVSKKSFSKIRFLSSDPNELSDILKLLIQKKEAGKNS